MAAKVKCVHCGGTYRVRLTDEHGRFAGYVRMCDCGILGIDQEIGYECGKGHCELYKQEDKDDGK